MARNRNMADDITGFHCGPFGIRVQQPFKIHTHFLDLAVITWPEYKLMLCHLQVILKQSCFTMFLFISIKDDLVESGDLMYYQSPYRAVKSKSKIIKVAGKGKVSAEPDIAEIRLGVSIENVALAKAQEDTAKAVANIIEAFAKAGIPENEVKTVDYSIHPQYDYVEGRQVFKNYRIEHMLLIKPNEINRAGALVDLAIKNGANVVSSVTFETSKYEMFYRKALSLAVLDALRKAETIAETFNTQLSKVPISVAEITGSDIAPYQTKTIAMYEAATSLHPGKLEIIGHIQAEFTYASL